MKHSITTYRRWARMHKVEGNHRKPLVVEHAAEHDCQNCGTHYKGNFCPNCGQTHKTQRFTISATVQHVVFFFAKFDSSFWHTCAELFYRPGHMIRDYIQGHRIDYFRPVQMLVCLYTAYIFLSIIFHTDATATEQLQHMQEASDAALQGHTVMLTITDYALKAMHSLIFINLAAIVLCVVPNWLCFRRTEIGKNTNLAEHFYILVYIACQIAIVDLVLYFPMLFLGEENAKNVSVFVQIILPVWAYHQYFKISWWRSAVLSILSTCLALLCAFFIVLAILLALRIAGII